MGIAHLEGGRNITIIGGKFDFFTGDTLDTNVLNISDSTYNDETRLIHIEGVIFDLADQKGDAIALNAETAIVQVQNTRFVGIHGDAEKNHSDAIQIQGGVKELRVYNATVQTDYQGFFLPPDQGIETTDRIDIRNVDFSTPSDSTPNFLWMVQDYDDGCVTYENGAFLKNVSAEQVWEPNFGDGETYPNTLHPDAPADDCKAVLNGAGDSITWPDWPSGEGPIEGSVEEGVPSGSDYVGVSDAGLSYTSPGYLVPTNLAISNNTSIGQSPQLSWTAPTGTIANYNIYRQAPASSTWSIIGTSTSTSYTDSGVEIDAKDGDNEFHYRVSAVYDDGDAETGLSDEASIYGGEALKSGQISSEKVSDDLPMSYSLSSNYPNPFNPSTTIQFAIPEETSVRLTIFDVQGKEIERLVDRHLPAGYHRVSWHSQNAPSGLYLYKLEAGEYSNTKHMILLK